MVAIRLTHQRNEMEFSSLLSQASLVIHSSDILADGKLALIRHADDWYHLRITDQGKLVLTQQN